MLVDPCSVSDRSKAWSACLWGVPGGVSYVFSITLIDAASGERLEELGGFVLL
jgi:hypothetical protein